MLTEIIKFKRNTVLAIRGLWLHKLRAFLSVLGIIIGIASVIALLAFGKGSMKEALDAIKRQGATNIIARSQKPSDDSSTASRSSATARVRSAVRSWTISSSRSG